MSDVSDRMAEPTEPCGAAPVPPLSPRGVGEGRIPRTVTLYWAYFCKGLVIAIIGACLLDLEAQTRCSSEEAALLLTWSSLGRIPGSTLAALIFDKFVPELQLGLVMTVMCLVTFPLPWVTNYPLLSFAMAVQGICIGFFGGACNAYCFGLWKEKAAPIIQGLHFTLSVGCSLAPLIAQPFLDGSLHSTGHCVNTSGLANQTTDCDYLGLAEPSLLLSSADPEMGAAMVYEEMLQYRHDNNLHTTVREEIYIANTSQHSLQNIGTLYSVANVSRDNSSDATHSTILYPYMILVCLQFVSIVAFFVLFVKDKCVVKRSASSKVSRISRPPAKHLPFLALFSVYFLILGGLEVTFGGLLVTFTVRALHWDKSAGMLVSTLYWSSLAGGRGLGILLTKLLRSQTILAVDVTLMTVSLSVLAVACDYHPAVTWVCSSVFGLAISTGIVNGLVMCNKTTAMSSQLVSFLMGSVFTGMMVVPGITGVLLKTMGLQWFVYTLLACSVILLFTFGAILLYVRLALRVRPAEGAVSEKEFLRGTSRVSTASSDSQISTDSGKSVSTTVTFASDMEDEPFIPPPSKKH